MTHMPNWKADQYMTPVGLMEGKVHRISYENASKAMCGKILAEMGGVPVSFAVSVTCKGCERSILSDQARALAKIKYEQEKAQREQKKLEWQQWYNAEYLASEKWQDIRRRVLARAGHTCEGCGINSATQVHHLTYEHVGHEFLFELLALCRDCHKRIHDAPADLP